MTTEPLHFSLIMTTRNRKAPLIRLFNSLMAQQYPHFTVIMGDQNPPGYLTNLLLPYAGKIFIIHHQLAPQSLSSARNALLPHAQGDCIALTDDDCYYAPDCLKQAASFFQKNPEVNALIGTFGGQHKQNMQPKIQTRYSIFHNAPSWLIFLRKNLVDIVGKFDENLGIGASTPWQSGEETDYLLRGLKTGHLLYRVPCVQVYHDLQRESSAQDFQKVYAYGLGRMKVLKKHKLPLSFKLLNIFYPLLAMCLKRQNCPQYYWHMFKGRWRGFWKI